MSCLIVKYCSSDRLDGNPTFRQSIYNLTVRYAHVISSYQKGKKFVWNLVDIVHLKQGKILEKKILKEIHKRIICPTPIFLPTIVTVITYTLYTEYIFLNIKILLKTHAPYWTENAIYEIILKLVFSVNTVIINSLKLKNISEYANCINNNEDLSKSKVRNLTIR